MWLGAAILLASCLLLGYEAAREYFPRFDLRSFDRQKGARLGAAPRAMLERELFNELPYWNLESRRYAGPSAGAQREHRWREMADDGLELAHIALQVFHPERGSIHPLAEPMARLEAMAREGDAGAMCLMTVLVDQARSKASAPMRDQAHQWLRKGTQLGHPECQLHWGRHLILGLDGTRPDARQGLSLEFAALAKGYVHDLDGVILHFQRRWSSSPFELTRLYCWLSIDQQFRVADSARQMLQSLRSQARRDGSDALLELADELERTNFPVERCLGMGFD